MTVVLKFGSSVLRTAADLPVAVDEVYRWYREGHRVVAVVSAFAGETDALVRAAATYGDASAPDVVASLIGTGEARSAALLTLALEQAGVPTALLDAGRLGLCTTPGLHATPVALDTSGWPDGPPVLVAPGFVGRDDRGRPTLLGRGGSDRTAVWLAAHLGARCRLIKDVDGVYDRSPDAPGARRYATLSWADALKSGSEVVQPDALALAAERGVALEVARAGAEHATTLGQPTELAPPVGAARPLRVVLLGHGTVGAGVWHGLQRYPERFSVVRVLTRTPRPGLPGHTTDPEEALSTPCDVVVELVGGVEPAGAWIRRALADGKGVVTANKAVLAADPSLVRAQRLWFSGAVGGAVPAIEAVCRHAERVVAIEGVLNGTTNHVLHRIDRGDALPDALASARAHGLCEADASRDLDGRDAADKLVILAKLAFGTTLSTHRVARDVTGLVPGVRQIARVDRDGTASVRLRVDPRFAELGGAGNAVVVHLDDGSTEVAWGLGAGRWPTATAVVADLLGLEPAGCTDA
ncbi:MAG: hypothetical protein ABMA64_32450 [Myxococcota bacterium]